MAVERRQAIEKNMENMDKWIAESKVRSVRTARPSVELDAFFTYISQELCVAGTKATAQRHHACRQILHVQEAAVQQVCSCQAT
jgi:hypothetical protein